jgi:hypothetical protein
LSLNFGLVDPEEVVAPRRYPVEFRRRLLVQITPDAQAIVDALLPSLHARERHVINDALTPSEQRQLLGLIARLQQAAIRARTAPPIDDATRVRPRHPTNQGTRP